MSLSRKQKIIIFAMILVACAIGGGVFYKRHSAQKAKNRLVENPFFGGERAGEPRIQKSLFGETGL